MVGPSTQEKLNSALDLIIESSQDFTDSAYTSHENRERILDLCDQLRIQLSNLIKIGASLVGDAFLFFLSLLFIP